MRLKKGWLIYMGRLVNRSPIEKHINCVMISGQGSSRNSTKGQLKLLVELECKYLIKIDYTKIPMTLHDYSNKIQEIIEAVSKGKVKSRKEKKNVELEFNILVNTIATVHSVDHIVNNLL